MITPERLPALLHERGIRQVIAFSGGSRPPTIASTPDVSRQLKAASDLLATDVLGNTLDYLSTYKACVGILTGGTKGGIPEQAACLAKAKGFNTIGIFPAAGAKHSLPDEVLDIAVCVASDLKDSCAVRAGDAAKFSSQWGDEASLFSKVLDGVLVLGGVAGTMVEVAHLLKLNERRFKDKLPPKFIVPIAGSGGIADALPYLPALPEVRAWCMPQRLIHSGTEAAKLLEDKLNLFDLNDLLPEERSASYAEAV